jgi:hypothetical protein
LNDVSRKKYRKRPSWVKWLWVMAGKRNWFHRIHINFLKTDDGKLKRPNAFLSFFYFVVAVNDFSVELFVMVSAENMKLMENWFFSLIFIFCSQAIADDDDDDFHCWCFVALMIYFLFLFFLRKLFHLHPQLNFFLTWLFIIN